MLINDEAHQIGTNQHSTPKQPQKDSLICNFCAAVVSDKSLTEHWRLECHLRQSFNEIVNAYGKGWKLTISQLEDFEDHVTTHKEFNQMFEDFVKQAQERGEEVEGEIFHAVNAINNLKATLLAKNISAAFVGKEGKQRNNAIETYNERIRKANEQAEIQLKKLEGLKQIKLDNYPELAPTIQKCLFWKNHPELLSDIARKDRQEEKKRDDDDYLDTIPISQVANIMILPSDSLEKAERKLGLAPGILKHVPFTLQEDGTIMLAGNLPMQPGKTVHSNTIEQPQWQGCYNIDPALEMESGAMAIRLNKFKPDPNAMYDRSRQDKYEHDIREMFQKERRRKIDKSKTLGKRIAFTAENTQITRVKAQRKRSKKRMTKLSPLQEAQRCQYSDNAIAQLLKKYKHLLKSHEEIFAPLSQRHTTTPFKFISHLFCDGISINDLVLPSMSEVASFFAERGVHVHIPQRSWRSRFEKKQQDKGQKQKKYFLRLKDENAVITPQLLQNLAKVMKDLREEAFKRKCKEKRDMKGSELDQQEMEAITGACNAIFIQKLDDTRDFQGCLYSTEHKSVMKDLCQLLDFSPSGYISSQSCFQMKKQDGTRVKLYSKDIHLLSSTSTTKGISIGLKPIFASRIFREKLAMCNDTTMSRIEHSVVFNSVEEEQTCLLDPATADTWNNNLTNIINSINNEHTVLQKINCSITRQELWSMFFQAISNTLVLKSRKQAAVIYAYNKIYKKYIGLLADTGFSATDLAAKFGIKECYLFDAISAENYSLLHLSRSSQDQQIPVTPFSLSVSNLDDSLKDIGIDAEKLAFKANISPSTISMQQVGERQQICTSEPEEQKILIGDAEEIEAMYSRHKGEIKSYCELDKSVLIHGIRCTNGKLTLYDYNNDCKYQLKYNFAEFVYLEQELIKLQHQLIEGMYVFINGIDNRKVGEYLGIAHYIKLQAEKQQEEEKEKQIQQERERKDKVRKALRQSQFRVAKVEEQELQDEGVVEEVQFNQQWQEPTIPQISLMSGQRAAVLRNKSRSPSPTRELGDEITNNIEGTDGKFTIKYKGFTFKRGKETGRTYNPHGKDAVKHCQFKIYREENKFYLV